MHKSQQPKQTQLARVSEAARILDVSVRFVWKLIAAGKLTPIRLGARRAVRVDLADIEKLIDAARAASGR